MSQVTALFAQARAGAQASARVSSPRRAALTVSLLLALGSASLWPAASALAAEPANAPPAAAASALSGLAPEDAFNRLVADFMRATTGDDSGVDALADAWRQLAAAHPNDLAVQAYAGATVTLKARASWLPWKKMQYAEDGLALLDKALARLDAAQNTAGHRGTPAVLEVKLTAANTFMALPGMFNRKERGQKLAGEVAASPLLASTHATFRQAVAQAQAKAQER